MGRMFITFDNLNGYLDSQYNGYCDEQRFLNDFYSVGFTKTSREVFDQNIERYPQIDFSYDHFKQLDHERLYDNYKMFLGNSSTAVTWGIDPMTNFTIRLEK